MKNLSRVMSQRKIICLLIMITCLISACTPDPIDSDIGTDSIYASIELRCVGNGLTMVDVTLSAGGRSGSDIYLINGDMLKVSANGQTQILVEDRDRSKIVRHLGTIPSDDPGTVVNISFERPSPIYVSALSSSIALPEEIEILSPQHDSSFDQQSTINITWEPVNISQEINITFKITCRNDQEVSSRRRSYTVNDSGSSAYSVSDLLNDWEIGANSICSADIVMIRETIGSVAAEFKDGEIRAERESIVTISINP